MDLDKIDRAILAALQADGRLSNAALSTKIGLSESACLRRVRALEESGIVDRYALLLNPAKLGRGGTVFVRVSLDSQRKDSLMLFEEAIRSVPEVMECYLMSGDVDYLIRVIVRDAADYERVHNELTHLPGVARVHSSFALRAVFKKTEIPLSPPARPS